MPAKFGAGQMIERVAFDRRAMVDDGYGNIVAGDFEEQFQARAKFIFATASETVMAGRLEGRQSIIVQIYMQDAAEAVGTDWQMRDVRRGKSYNVREVHEDRTRLLLELLVEGGVAT